MNVPIRPGKRWRRRRPIVSKPKPASQSNAPAPARIVSVTGGTPCQSRGVPGASRRRARTSVCHRIQPHRPLPSDDRGRRVLELPRSRGEVVPGVWRHAALPVRARRMPDEPNRIPASHTRQDRPQTPSIATTSWVAAHAVVAPRTARITRNAARFDSARRDGRAGTRFLIDGAQQDDRALRIRRVARAAGSGVPNTDSSSVASSDAASTAVDSDTPARRSARRIESWSVISVGLRLHALGDGAGKDPPDECRIGFAQFHGGPQLHLGRRGSRRAWPASDVHEQERKRRQRDEQPEERRESVIGAGHLSLVRAADRKNRRRIRRAAIRNDRRLR